MKLPNNKYQIIYADPPWSFKTYSEKGKDRSPEKYYNTESIEEIKKIPIQDITDENCVLFMWATYPTLPQAFEVIKAWGFTYKTVAFTWTKITKNKKEFIGLGYWTRANPEICLLATKGKPKRKSADVRNWITSIIREHSRKPDEIRDRIVRLLGDLPRIELFARQRTEGWSVWGNQVPELIS